MEFFSYMFFWGEKVWFYVNVKLLFWWIFPTEITFSNHKIYHLSTGAAVNPARFARKTLILMTEVFMRAIAQWQITPKHHFYRRWHGNLITVMHGFPVGVIIAFFVGSPFSRHACPDALTQGQILGRVCRASPAYALAMHIFMRQ